MTAMADDSGVSANKKMRMSRESDKSRETRDELWKTTREALVERVIRQQQEIDILIAKQTSDSSLDELRETVEKLKLQVAESARQESLLVMRLAAKEQEVQELLGQISELKQALNPSSAQLQSMLLDPAVNLLFMQMKREMDTCRSQLEQSQKDLAAWKFTPDSQTGKRLMAKCRMLLQENEELGRSVSSGRLAKLEGDIALQKRLIAEMKNSEKDTEEFLGDVDEDLEAMQGTVYLLQQELKDAKERLQKQQQEIEQLREGAAATAVGTLVISNSAPAAAVAPSGGCELTAVTSESKQQTGDRSSVSGAATEQMDGTARTAATSRKDSGLSHHDEDRGITAATAKKVSSSSSESQQQHHHQPTTAVSGNHRTLAGEAAVTAEKMDVDEDGEIARVGSEPASSTKRGHSNASRTSPVRHSNDHHSTAATSMTKTENKKEEGSSGRHHRSVVVDRCRTASSRHSSELGGSATLATAVADCVPNGTDDDKSVATAVSN
jgi:archaellum component FlaC